LREICGTFLAVLQKKFRLMGQTLVYGILNGALYGIIALGIALVFES